MNRFATILITLAATASLASCSIGTQHDLDDLTPAAAPTVQPDPGTDLAAADIASRITKGHQDSKWVWHLGKSADGEAIDVKIVDGALIVPLHDAGRDAAVEICEATRKAVKAAGFEPMPVTVKSIESYFPLAMSDPESEFDKKCSAR